MDKQGHKGATLVKKTFSWIAITSTTKKHIWKQPSPTGLRGYSPGPGLVVQTLPRNNGQQSQGGTGVPLLNNQAGVYIMWNTMVGGGGGMVARKKIKNEEVGGKTKKKKEKGRKTT